MADTKELLVELKLEDKQYKKGMKEVADGTTSGGKKMSSTFDKLKKNWMAITAAIAGAVLVVKSWVNAAIKQENADRRLAQSIKNTGDQSKKTYGELKKFASELQGITTIGDETTQEIMAFGMGLGISTDKIKDATKGAIGLSRIMGPDGDLQNAMKLTSMAMNGSYDALARYIPELRTATTEAEKQAAVQKAMANGLEMAKSETLTYGGAVKQMENALGDVKETLGAIIIPMLVPLVKWIKSAAEGFQQLPGPVQKATVGLVGLALGIKGISVAMAMMNLNPIVLGFTAIAVAGIGIVSIMKKMQSNAKSAAGALQDWELRQRAIMITEAQLAKERLALQNQISDSQKEAIQRQINQTELTLDAKKKEAEQLRQIYEERLKLENETADKEIDLSGEMSNFKIEMEKLTNEKIIEEKQTFIDRWNAAEGAGAKTRVAIAEWEANEKIQAARTAIGDIAGLTESSNKTLFAIGKATSIAQAIINNAQAITKTMATVPFPFNIPLAAGQAAAGGVQIAKIKSQNIPKYSEGGVIDSVSPANISGEDGVIGARLGESVLNQEATAVLGKDAIDALNAGRGIFPNVNITVNSQNGQNVVDTINDYFRQYGGQRALGVG